MSSPSLPSIGRTSFFDRTEATLSKRRSDQLEQYAAKKASLCSDEVTIAWSGSPTKEMTQRYSPLPLRLSPLFEPPSPLMRVENIEDADPADKEVSFINKKIIKLPTSPLPSSVTSLQKISFLPEGATKKNAFDTSPWSITSSVSPGEWQTSTSSLRPMQKSNSSVSLPPLSEKARSPF